MRASLRAKLAGVDREVLEATVMAASELVENVIKYGQGGPPPRDGSFRFALTDSQITLEVCSGLHGQAQFQVVKGIMEEIAQSTDTCDLYAQRLRALLEGDIKTGSAGLGLCRIAAEGHFSLACSYQDNTLTVVATRSLGEQHGA